MQLYDLCFEFAPIKTGVQTRDKNKTSVTVIDITDSITEHI